MRKAMLTTVLLSVLLLALVFVWFSSLARANPMEMGKIFEDREISPSAVDAKPPTVAFQSPQENAIYGSTVMLRCNISAGASKIDYPASISYISYKGDWQKTTTPVQFKGTWGIDKLYVKGDLTYFSTNITVPEGKHNITVWATQIGSYQEDTGQKFHGSELIKINSYHLGASATVSFTVDCTAPAVLVLSTDNKTYNTADVPLQFNVNESESQYTYCLDGQPASAVEGNSTLTNLPNGNHNLTVYAVDEAGNVGASETVTFEVDVPFPTMQVIVTAAILSPVVIVLPILLFKRHKSKTALS
jgi:hypothetical protein